MRSFIPVVIAMCAIVALGGWLTSGHGEWLLGETVTGVDIYDYPESDDSFTGYQPISCPKTVNAFWKKASVHWAVDGTTVTDRSYAMYNKEGPVLVAILHVDGIGRAPHIDELKCFRSKWHSWLTW